MSFDNYGQCYEILGVHKAVDWPALRLAYRRRLRSCHPDLQPVHAAGDGQRNDDEFKHVVHAFRSLARYYESYGELPRPDIPIPSTTQGALAVRTGSNEGLRQHEDQPNRPHGNIRSTRSPIPRAARVAVTGFVLAVTTVAAANYVVQRKNALDVAQAANPTGTTSRLNPGMDPGQVLEVQGVPTLTKGSVWFYGESGVIFDRGCVSGWENAPPYPLRTDVSVYTLSKKDDAKNSNC